MPSAFRLLALVAAIVVPLHDVAAQSRAQNTRTAKLSPKLSAVTITTNAAQLVAMIAGSGVTVSNATFRGAPAAAGTFSGAQVTIGLDTGVVLSTGRADDVKGPNSDTAWSTDNLQGGDTDLDALVAPYTTFDAAVLEFDIVPVGSTVAMRYVFASEEYNEFVGSPYNDVIAIFVNGVNCANVAGRPVSVNTINAQSNAVLYVDNETGMRDTEMDGMTVPIDCVAAVTPGQLAHVKIAVGDTSDSIYDSAIFLLAGGLRSPGVGAPTTSNTVKVIEYHHAAFDHYFITALPAEIAKLDDGTFAGWARTGFAFNVFLSGTPNTAEVCRFFSTAFAPKSSHFYTPDATECETVKKSKSWEFEATVFNVLPPAQDGSCPSTALPLYRLYNDGMGAAPNHRYVTDHAQFDVMQALGWKPEGQGEGVIACVPK